MNPKIETRKLGTLFLIDLARDTLKADLVDELHLGVVPVLLEAGIPLFPSGFPQRDFSLLENKAYSQSMIALKYERA